MVVALLAAGVLFASNGAVAAAGSSEPVAAVAKKKCKKGKKSAAAAKKKKCKKRAPAVLPPAAPATVSTNPPPPPPPPPPDTRTTEQKIDDAVASGEITAEQGLEYKVFAAFGDPRLPSPYLGRSDPLAEAPLDDVEAQWSELSGGAKAILGPFLIPPMHHGSYWEQLIEGAGPSSTASASLARAAGHAADPNSPWCDTTVAGGVAVALENWHFVEATTGPAAGKVRIWYQDRYAATDAGLAASLMSAMEGKIWPALTTLMQSEPLPDGGSTESCAGGSDAVDIALVDAPHATTYSHSLSQESTAAKMIFPRTGIDATAPFLAHEFMHMIQYSFAFSSGGMASGENAWLKEGTAQWAQDYVSNSHYSVGLTPEQTEWNALPYFFPYPDKSLDSTDPNHHDYGTYLFWMWAARKGNDPTIVRQVWNAVATQKSLSAAKSVFGSGWAQVWRDFARAVWNQDPITNFQAYDQIPNTPKVESDTTLPNEPTPVITTVAPVAAKYLTFKPDTGVNSLTYQNLGGLSDEAGIQAIINYKDGSSTVEDWTQIAKQDVPMCNVDKLTLVLSNASVTPSDSRAFSLSFAPPTPGATKRTAADPRAEVCVPDPQGSFSGTAHYDDTVTTVVDWTWSGNVDFDPNGQANAWFTDYESEVWDNATVASGSITVSGTGTVEGDETCTVDIPAASYDLGPGDGSMIIQPGPEPHYGIQLYGPPIIQGTITCPGDDPYTGGFSSPAAVYTPDPEQTMTRGSYQGSASFSNEFFVESMNWNLADP